MRRLDFQMLDHHLDFPLLIKDWGAGALVRMRLVGDHSLALLDTAMSHDPRHRAIIARSAATEEGMAVGADDVLDFHVEGLQTGIVHPDYGIFRIMDDDDVLHDIHDDVEDGLAIIVQPTVLHSITVLNSVILTI
jgi:hypothetical protein